MPVKERSRFTKEERAVIGSALAHYIQSIKSDTDEDRSDEIQIAERLLPRFGEVLQ